MIRRRVLGDDRMYTIDILIKAGYHRLFADEWPKSRIGQDAEDITSPRQIIGDREMIRQLVGCFITLNKVYRHEIEGLANGWEKFAARNGALQRWNNQVDMISKLEIAAISEVI